MRNKNSKYEEEPDMESEAECFDYSDEEAKIKEKIEEFMKLKNGIEDSDSKQKKPQKRKSNK